MARVQVRRSDLRRPLPADFAVRLTGRRVVRIARRAKYMLWHLDDGMVAIVHLGMSGRMVVSRPGEAVGAHDHVLFRTEAGDEIRFVDARRFGLLALASGEGLAGHPLLANLGPEPLDEAFDGQMLSAALRGRKAPIKAALLDQRRVAGLGNIYVCEALFRAGISPRRLARSVAGRRAARLVVAIKAVLREAIEDGGSTLRDHVRPSGDLGYFQHRFAVYGREGEACPGCDCELAQTRGIRRLVQSGRSTFWCSRRQR